MSKKDAEGREIIILEEEPEKMEELYDSETFTMLNGVLVSRKRMAEEDTREKRIARAKAARSERKRELKTARSNVEKFEEEEKDIIAETEKHDQTLHQDIGELNCNIGEAWNDRGKMGAHLRIMMEVFREFEEKLVADEKKAKIISPKKTLADLLAGRIDKYQYAIRQAGVNYSIILDRERICGLIAEIRDWRIEMNNLENEVVHSEKLVAFRQAMLLKNEIDRCKAHQKVLDARLAERLIGLPMGSEEWEQCLDEADSIFPYKGLRDMEELYIKELRLDPALSKKQLGRLEEILQQISGTGKKYRILFYPENIEYYEEE